MKRALFTIILLWSLTGLAQQRMIAHVTRLTGGFQSRILIANTTDFSKDYRFTAYDSTGSQIAVAEGSLAAQTTATQTVDALFGVPEISHFLIDETSEVAVSIAYQAEREGSGPAHVRETQTQSVGWRIYPGNPQVTWDGLAVVNMGETATDIVVRQGGAGGNTVQRTTVIQGLVPMGKGLYLFDTDFQQVPDSFFEVSAAQPLAITALRGNLNSDFLWENAGSPFVPAPSAGSYGLEQAFQISGFNAPVDFQSPDDDTNRAFIVEIPGRIKVFPNEPSANNAEEFLDITQSVTVGGEMGLLGLAFHPDYRNNGYFFVNYTSEVGGPRRTVISRFSTAADPDRAEPNSELILLEVTQPQANHNGGQLSFGPDGYLYIALGDGGGGGDPGGHGQDLSTCLGSILRIDVDNPTGGLNYGIPADNPFVGSGQGIREEIFAYGLRNPWRFSFDVTAEGTDLWAADVGQNAFEEINIILSGQNYGWNTMEGNSCISPAVGCDTNDLTLPVLAYSHNNGDQSVTGGFVYRGSKLPGLYGSYIYADFWSGRFFALQTDGDKSPVNTQLFQFGARLVASFGVDQQNELYICSFDGNIYRLVAN